MSEQRDKGAEQAAFWNGPGGKMWLAAYDRIERSLADLGALTIDAASPKPGEQVLDVGCGTGGTTADIAKRVAPDGSVLGVDISEALLAAARERRTANARFELGDAATFPFGEASFDLVFSRFGVMFFGDPVAAFKNLRRAMKPAGRLVFVCWRTPKENPWGLVPLMAAAPHLPPFERPGPEDPGQYAFGDRARVERILTGAGFVSPSFEKVDRPTSLGKDIAEAISNMSQFGPLARLFKEATAEQVAKAKDAVAAALQPYVTSDGVMLASACWLVRASR